MLCLMTPFRLFGLKRDKLVRCIDNFQSFRTRKRTSFDIVMHREFSYIITCRSLKNLCFQHNRGVEVIFQYYWNTNIVIPATYGAFGIVVGAQVRATLLSVLVSFDVPYT